MRVVVQHRFARLHGLQHREELGALRLPPGGKVERSGGEPAAERRDPAAMLADVAGERLQGHERLHGSVTVIPVRKGEAGAHTDRVVVAPELGEHEHVAHLEVGDLGHAFGRVLGHGVGQDLHRGAGLDAGGLMGAEQLGLLRLAGRLEAAVGVDDHVVVAAEPDVLAAQELLRFRIDEERRDRVLPQVGRVVEPLLDHVVDDAVDQRRVRARPDGQPRIGARRGAGVARVDGDDRRALRLRLLDDAPVGDASLGHVAGPQHDDIGVQEVRSLVGVEDAAGGHLRVGEHVVEAGGCRAVALVAAFEVARAGAGHAGEPVADADHALDDAERAGVRRDPEGVLAVLVLDLLELGGDRRRGLVPADALPFA